MVHAKLRILFSTHYAVLMFAGPAAAARVRYYFDTSWSWSYRLLTLYVRARRRSNNNSRTRKSWIILRRARIFSGTNQSERARFVGRVWTTLQTLCQILNLWLLFRTFRISGPGHSFKTSLRRLRWCTVGEFWWFRSRTEPYITQKGERLRLSGNKYNALTRPHI